MHRQLRGSAQGVRRIVTDLVGRTQGQGSRCSQMAAGERFKLRLTIRSELPLSHREECSTLPAPSGVPGDQVGRRREIFAIFLQYLLQFTCMWRCPIPSVQNLLRSAPSLIRLVGRNSIARAKSPCSDARTKKHCQGRPAYLVCSTPTAWDRREFRRGRRSQDCLIAFGRHASMGYGAGGLSEPARAHPS